MWLRVPGSGRCGWVRLCRGCRSFWAVVDCSVEVVACGTFDVAADAECDFAFAVEKEEAWRRGVGEVGLDGVVEYSDEVSAVFGVA